MLKLKPLGEPQGRSIVQISNLLPSLRIQVYHPHTCTHVRLLGPCFKTGRWKPFRQPRPKPYLSRRGSSNQGYQRLPPEVIRPQQPRLTHSTRNTEHERPATPVALGMVELAPDNLVKQDWFQPLPFQRLQALLTLFPKSFSPFPHGTFMLSVLSPYLALDEIYHPFALQSQGT